MATLPHAGPAPPAAGRATPGLAAAFRVRRGFRVFLTRRGAVHRTRTAAGGWRGLGSCRVSSEAAGLYSGQKGMSEERWRPYGTGRGVRLGTPAGFLPTPALHARSAPQLGDARLTAEAACGASGLTPNPDQTRPRAPPLSPEGNEGLRAFGCCALR